MHGILNITLICQTITYDTINLCKINLSDLDISLKKIFYIYYLLVKYGSQEKIAIPFLIKRQAKLTRKKGQRLFPSLNSRFVKPIFPLSISEMVTKLSFELFHTGCSHLVEDGKHLVITQSLLIHNTPLLKYLSLQLKLCMHRNIHDDHHLTLSMPCSTQSLIFTASLKHHLDSVYLLENTTMAILESSILFKRMLISSPLSS